MQWQCNFCVTKTRHILVQICLGLVLSILFGLGFGFFIMLLWNNVLSDIWGWKEITYWQGAGLVVLTRLLFGSQGYHKAAHQPQRGCYNAFSPTRANCSDDLDAHYFEKWWKEEGEISLEKYTEKLLKQEEWHRKQK